MLAEESCEVCHPSRRGRKGIVFLRCLATTTMCHMVHAVLICDTSTISKLLLGPALQAIMCSSALLTSVLVSISMAGHSMILWLVVEIMLITSLSLLLKQPHAAHLSGNVHG